MDDSAWKFSDVSYNSSQPHEDLEECKCFITINKAVMKQVI